jgi:hypothetical protein
MIQSNQEVHAQLFTEFTVTEYFASGLNFSLFSCCEIESTMVEPLKLSFRIVQNK